MTSRRVVHRNVRSNPETAFRLLRDLHRAQALWGSGAALPIAMLRGDDASVALGTLRLLLELEREGAVVVQRATRLVSLAEPRETAAQLDWRR